MKQKILAIILIILSIVALWIYLFWSFICVYNALPTDNEIPLMAEVGSFILLFVLGISGLALLYDAINWVIK